MKRKSTLFIGVMLICLVGLCALTACTTYDKYCALHVDGVISINHRGHSAVAPENTLAAFRLSKEMGFGVVECDVQFTKDGVPVLLHDDTVDRTSNGSGKLANLTFDEVRALDFGSWKSDKYVGEQIPTFAEFLQLCDELQLYPYVELKGSISYVQLKQLAEIVSNSDVPCTWIARDRNYLKVMKNWFTNGRFGYIVDTINADGLNFAKALSTDSNQVFIDCNYKNIDSSAIALCKQYDIPLEVWTLNSEELILGIDDYVSGVCSDGINAQEVLNRPTE